MTPDEIIDRANKGDTSLSKRKYSPREQWEAPGGADVYGAGWEGESLRAKKVADFEHSHKRRFASGISHMEPVTLSHGRLGKDLPTLSEGHHRLAYAELHGVPFVNVEHVLPSPSWVEMQNILSETGRRPPRKPSPSYQGPKIYTLSSGLTMRSEGGTVKR
jgi:hypothetical protein